MLVCPVSCLLSSGRWRAREVAGSFQSATLTSGGHRSELESSWTPIPRRPQACPIKELLRNKHLPLHAPRLLPLHTSERLLVGGHMDVSVPSHLCERWWFRFSHNLLSSQIKSTIHQQPPGQWQKPEPEPQGAEEGWNQTHNLPAMKPVQLRVPVQPARRCSCGHA